MTASQRRRTSVSSRTLRPVRWASSVACSVMATMYAFAARAQPSPSPHARRGEHGGSCLLPRARPRATCAVPRRATFYMAKIVEPVIAVDQLVKVYKTTRAVDGISFGLEPGSITGLLGGNGAGKTTTIAMITGLVMPTSGTVKVLGAAMPRQR